MMDSSVPPSHVTIDTKQMQSELDRRQQELESKARELAEREEALRRKGGDFQRQHNWPPLPAFCPLKPCFFQDISIDIKPEFQNIVEQGYRLWAASAIVLLVNLVASIAIQISGSLESNLASAIFTFVLFVPLTYVAWFRPLYKAFKNDSSFNFMVFFFVFFLQTLVAGLWALGLNGMNGLFMFIAAVSKSVTLSLLLLVSTCAWAAYVALSAFLLMNVHSIYRSSGANMAKARSEFTQGIISNSYVQQTVVNAARQTVSTAASTATQGVQP